ncbi:MAG TPA: PIN domain-containing protein [Vicinamibacterales bacterium]|nr:PIN domain-containing protein [Vicinamibacterales bacterium]
MLTHWKCAGRNDAVLIVVDSSVWIDVHRHRHSPNGVVLESLLEADEVALAWPVRVELVGGVSKQDRPALIDSLSGLPVLYPTNETWQLLDTWVSAAADRGRRFSLADWLIATLAREIGGLVWSLDNHFAEMERLKFIGCYEPPVQ